MENPKIVTYSHKKGVCTVHPTHPMVKHWAFTEDDEDQAIMANSIAVVAEKNGMSVNDLQHLFPAILRMVGDKSTWSKI